MHILSWSMSTLKLMEIHLFRKGHCFVHLKNNTEGLSNLYKHITYYYEVNRDRLLLIFDHGHTEGYGRIYVRYLLDKKHVVEYSIFENEGAISGEIAMFSLVLAYVFDISLMNSVGEKIRVIAFCLFGGFFLLRSLLSIISIRKRLIFSR